jgi:dTDP-4-dehydrorhamnose reductase
LKILLIGKTGQLGGDLLRNGGKDHEFNAPDRDTLNIDIPESASAVIHSFYPEIVINTAAFHNVPLCEIEPEKAFAINCIAIKNLANCCKKIGAWFITFSTDYVFGGEKGIPYAEEDKPFPLQIYGISKLAGEFAALATWPTKSIIIRTCGLYGMHGAHSKGGNFVDKRIDEAKTHRSLKMGCDQVVCPTYTDDLSRAVIHLVEHPRLQPGIYHLVNEDKCTWYDFTRAIYEIMGISIELNPVDRGGMTGTMRRPLYSVLANTKAKAMGIILPHWRNGLERYLGNKYGI